MSPMRRVSVVGSSGAGKSTFGRELARRLGVPFTELDAVHHRAGWTPIDPGEFVSHVTEVVAQDGWVVDGNYRTVVRDGPVWQRADTVIWLDVPKAVALWQVTRRTVGRAVTRAELWNGNRERWADIVSWDPERSMIRWVWTTHGEVRERYERLSVDPDLGHIRFVRLRNRREMARFLDDA
jgi:adenylate kinase family enzyme